MSSPVIPSISIARISSLHPVLRDRAHAWLDACLTIGIPVLVTEGGRDWNVQAAYYAKGRTVMSDIGCRHGSEVRKPGTCAEHPLGATVTNAKPGMSMHQYYLALDACPLDAQGKADWNAEHQDWRTMLKVAKQFKLAEGADWRTRPDNPHFYPEELPANPPDELRLAYQSGGLEAAWAWANNLIKA